MAKEILYNGVKYPLQFNMLVFRNWETETKKKISDLGTLANGSGAVEAVDALTLLYFAIQDACDEKEIEFIVTLKSFLRNVDFSNMGEMMSLIDLGESENKRQPKKPKA
jgi:uncharacterized protein YjaG (DUF416 family)